MSLSSMLLAPLYDRLTRPSEEACVSEWRAELLGDLRGEVLEIGAGTGANLPHYGRAVDRLVISEPDRHMRRRLQRRLTEVAASAVELSDASADRLPMADESFDVVVSTLVLCSVADQARALAEYRRVLRPGGALVFIEHVAAHDRPDRLRWQRRIEPIWKRVFGNCHLTRDTASAIERAGFEMADLRRQSMRKATPVVRPTIRGVARLLS
jgi:ubiquinone/menaquinone biosynthesis C-methylase UbiE